MPPQIFWSPPSIHSDQRIYSSSRSPTCRRNATSLPIAIVNPPAFSGLFAQTSVYVTGSSDLTDTTIKYTQPRTIIIRPLNSSASAPTTGTDPALALTSSLANYPNPFHGATNIVYTLPNDSHVTLRVFDATGISVATLLDEDEPAGEHILPYSSGRLAAGVYEYQFVAVSAQGEFSAVKQMVVR